MFSHFFRNLFFFGAFTFTSVFLFDEDARAEPMASQNFDCSRAVPVDHITDAEIQNALQGNGLIGYVHGFAERSLQGSVFPVFTVRSRTDFFSATQVNLIGQSQAVIDAFLSLNRHDKICVKGEFADFGASQKHVFVTHLGVVERYLSSFPDLPPYQYSTPAIESLPKQGRLEARIHAVVEDALILEVGDRIAPLVVHDSNFIPHDLFRFDRVSFAYFLDSKPGRLAHIVLDESAADPFRVLQKIKDIDGEKVLLHGVLSVYPKSPQILQDTYALKVSEAGFETNYTLVNFEDSELFAEIRAKLSELWVENSSGAKRGRNFYFNPDVRLQVSGVANIRSPAQANPQILIDDLNQIQLEK